MIPSGGAFGQFDRLGSVFGLEERQGCGSLETMYSSPLWTVRLALLLCVITPCLHARAAQRPPNVVIIFTDDQGYGDLGCFGAKNFKTPNLDRLAATGVRLANFHVAQPVCSASRAALMTGCYPNRIGIHGALGPASKSGLSPRETTIARMLKTKGYKTAHYGKWHLGHEEPFLPPAHGFDESLGLPYSGDMWPHHPEARPGSYPPLPLYENGKVIDAEIDPHEQAGLTERYTIAAVEFIRRNSGTPFFLYLAPNQPHVPLFVGDRYKGKSGAGLYGDVIEEIDAAVGRVLDALKQSGLEKDTLVIFSSDNGPWLSYGEHAGSAGPLREGKGTVFEGGIRVPGIAAWPGRIPAGSVSEAFHMTIDLLPTIAEVTGAEPPPDIDGRTVWNLWSGHPELHKPQDAYYLYYNKNELQGVVSWPWKLLFPHKSRTMAGKPRASGGIPGKYSPLEISEPMLFNLAEDLSESRNLYEKLQSENPALLEHLNALAGSARARMGDALKGIQSGSSSRSAGVVPAP